MPQKNTDTIIDRGLADHSPVRVLLIGEKRQDYAAIGGILLGLADRHYELTWCNCFEHALEAMLSDLHQVVLLDCQTDNQASDELLQLAVKQGCRTPIIVMTDEVDEVLDREAIRSGAAPPPASSWRRPDGCWRCAADGCCTST